MHEQDPGADAAPTEEWEAHGWKKQKFGGMDVLVLDTSKAGHDLAMRMDAEYRENHQDKEEKGKGIPWALRTQNRPIIAIAALIIAGASAVIATELIKDAPQQGAEISKKL